MPKQCHADTADASGESAVEAAPRTDDRRPTTDDRRPTTDEERGRRGFDFGSARAPARPFVLELDVGQTDAVHYAHQNGVIHRDLKPGNILVDGMGQPKILDFGVARATDSDLQVTTLRTDVGQLIGTLAYMSPEQVAADPDQLDTRSDIYALGLIAYELLAGVPAYNIAQKSIPEAARIIREEDPARLSSINRVFRGDVETIVAKALEKDKNRRYRSAAEFADDLRRHLSDEAIVARPPSTAYQVHKFARRNKALVLGLCAVFAASLAGTVVSTVMYRRAETARAAPQESDFQNSLAASYGNLAGVYILLGRLAEAGAIYEKALPVRETLITRHPSVLTYRLLYSSTACNLGELRLRQELAERSLPWFDKALATLNRILEQEPRHNTARYYSSYTYALRARAHETLGNRAEALGDLDHAIRPDDRNDASLRSRRAALAGTAPATPGTPPPRSAAP